MATDTNDPPNRSHAAELGNHVPKEPLLFLKPVSSYVEMGGAIEVSPSHYTLY